MILKSNLEYHATLNYYFFKLITAIYKMLCIDTISLSVDVKFSIGGGHHVVIAGATLKGAIR